MSIDATASYPVAASVDEGLVIAWTSGGSDDSVIRLVRANSSD